MTEFHEFAALNRFANSLGTSFYNSDYSRSGYLSASQVRQALVSSNLQCSMDDCSKICNIYSNEYGVSIENFLIIAADLGT